MHSSSKKSVKFVGLVLAFVLMLATAACSKDTTSSGASEARISEDAAKKFNHSQPPFIVDASQARENLNAAELALATGANTWTAVMPRGGSFNAPIFECPSIGFPIPFASNITNPLKIASNERGAVTLGQIEPTLGIYTPATDDTTYGNCVMNDGTVKPFTSQSDLTTFGFDVVWDDTLHRFVIPPTGNGTVVRKEGTVVTITRLTPAQINAHAMTEAEAAKLNNTTPTTK
jgi:hypothetical protein